MKRYWPMVAVICMTGMCVYAQERTETVGEGAGEAQGRAEGSVVTQGPQSVVGYESSMPTWAKTSQQAVDYSMPAPRPADIENVTVAKIIDGDTLQLADGRRLLLIGLASPNSAAGRAKFAGLNPYEYYQTLRREVEGRAVNVEFDTVRNDPNGRLLGYVHVVGGNFVNAEILRQGYAISDDAPPNVRYRNLFNRYYQEAKQYRRGYWSRK